MSNHWKDYWQELHHGEQEYCRKSGPLNSRKISAAKAKTTQSVLSSGLGLVASAAAAVGLALAIAALYVTTAPVSIGENQVSIHVSVHNRQEDEQIEYVLSKELDPDTPIEQGVLQPDEGSLEFEDLESNTSYVVEYFVEKDGVREKVGEFRFTTDGPVEEGSSTPETTTSPPATTDPPETSGPGTTSSESQSEENTTEAEETTTEEETTTQAPTTQAPTTQAPTTQAPTTQAPTTQAPATQAPTTGAESTTPGSSTSAPEVENTTPGGGTSAPDVENTTPEGSTTAPEGADPSQDIQVSAELVSVIPEGDWDPESYRATERHTFTNVSSADAVITVLQGGQQVAYQMSYNSGTRTLVIEFMGNSIPAGGQATSLVTVEDVDGRSATSGLTIQAPDLNSLDMTVTPNGDGTYTFTLTVGVTQPSHGSLSFESWIMSGAEESVTDTFEGTGSTVTYSVTMHVTGIGMVYAYADLYATWSYQEPDTAPLYIGLSDELGYETGAGSSLEFELHEGTYTDNSGAEIPYYPYPHEYDVIATFNGLGAITPLCVDFERCIATRYLTDDLYYGYEYGDMEWVITIEDLAIGEDGAIRATYKMPDQTIYEDFGDALWQNERHEWVAILYYLDAEGNEQQVYLDGFLEMPEYAGITSHGTLRRLENGSYEAELDLEVEVVGGSHGAFVLDYVEFNESALMGERLQIKEWSMEDGILRILGTVPANRSFDFPYNLYAHWKLTNKESNFTTGSGVSFMRPSHFVSVSPVADGESEVVRYESRETFAFSYGDSGGVVFSTVTAAVSDPDNVRDLEITLDETNEQILVTFVRMNQEEGEEVISEIDLKYISGYEDTDGTIYYPESRRIITYETYWVGPS